MINFFFRAKINEWDSWSVDPSKVKQPNSRLRNFLVYYDICRAVWEDIAILLSRNRVNIPMFLVFNGIKRASNFFWHYIMLTFESLGRFSLLNSHRQGRFRKKLPLNLEGSNIWTESSIAIKLLLNWIFLGFRQIWPAIDEILTINSI